MAGNIGAADRYEYTVIGDPVNEAARLSEEAKCYPGRTLASGAAVLDSNEEAVNWVECGSTLLRGRTNPTAMYEPTGDRRTEPAA